MFFMGLVGEEDDEEVVEIENESSRGRRESLGASRRGEPARKVEQSSIPESLAAKSMFGYRENARNGEGIDGWGRETLLLSALHE